MQSLTKEDLIYILEGIFKISDAIDNALQKTESGWYVQDYATDLANTKTALETRITDEKGDLQKQIDQITGTSITDLDTRIKTNATDIKNHVDNGDIHVTKIIRDVIARLSVDEDGNFCFDNQPLSIVASMLSQEDGNAIQQKPDGIYMANQDLTIYDNHLKNNKIHITQTERETWSAILGEAQNYTDTVIGNQPIHDIYITTVLPTTNIDAGCLYLLADNPDRPLECTYTMHLWFDGAWATLGVTNKTLSQYVTFDELDQIILNNSHANRGTLDKIGETATGAMTFDGKTLIEGIVSSEPDNAITVKNNALYAKDFSKEIKDLETGAALAKVNLYNQEISSSGTYQLKDSIDNYNLLLIEYYYKPNSEDTGTPGCIQTAVVDPDTLNDAYKQGMLYILQYGYGVMTSNSQFHIVEDKITVDYYNNVCIYKITGIRKGVEEDANPTTE